MTKGEGWPGKEANQGPAINQELSRDIGQGNQTKSVDQFLTARGGVAAQENGFLSGTIAKASGFKLHGVLKPSRSLGARVLRLISTEKAEAGWELVGCETSQLHLGLLGEWGNAERRGSFFISLSAPLRPGTAIWACH